MIDPVKTDRGTRVLWLSYYGKDFLMHPFLGA